MIYEHYTLLETSEDPNFDLTNSELAGGDHLIVVQAVAEDGTVSEYSEPVVYTQEHDRYVINKDTLVAIADSIRSRMPHLTGEIYPDSFPFLIKSITDHLPAPTIYINGPLLVIDTEHTSAKVDIYLVDNISNTSYTLGSLSEVESYDLSNAIVSYGSIPAGIHDVYVQLSTYGYATSLKSNVVQYTSTFKPKLEPATISLEGTVLTITPDPTMIVCPGRNMQARICLTSLFDNDTVMYEYTTPITSSDLGSVSYDLSTQRISKGIYPLYVYLQADGYEESDPTGETYIQDALHQLMPATISLEGTLLTIDGGESEATSALICLQNTTYETHYYEHTTSTLTEPYDLSELDLLPSGVYDIHVIMKNSGFIDSESSNVVNYTVTSMPKLSTPVVSNQAYTNTLKVTDIDFRAQELCIAIIDQEGGDGNYTTSCLPPFEPSYNLYTLFGSDIEPSVYTVKVWLRADGCVSSDTTAVNYYHKKDISKLSAPTISLVGTNILQITNIDGRTEYLYISIRDTTTPDYEIYDQMIDKPSEIPYGYDLSALNLPAGTYDISVTNNLHDTSIIAPSDPSNVVQYTVSSTNPGWGEGSGGGGDDWDNPDPEGDDW